MSLHFERELERLKQQVVALGGLVEESVLKAVQAVSDNSETLASEVITLDHRIDEAEVEVEEACLKIMALYQPVAIDLRFIVAVLKINNDLERIGDLSVNIAKRVALINQEPGDFTIPPEILRMAEASRDMLRFCLDALVRQDKKLALDVLAADDEVDGLNKHIYKMVKENLKSDRAHITSEINVLTIARKLERMADHATNIAEDILYMIDGTIVRHGGSLA